MSTIEAPIQEDVRRLLGVARRWWWLLLLGPLVVGLTTYAISSRQSPVYSATATLGVNLAGTNGNVDIGTIQGSKSLVETYRHLVDSSPVLEPVVEELALADGEDGLRRRIWVNALRDTQLLTISVSDTDSERAAATANAVARQFIAFVAQPAADAAASNVTQLEARIEDTEQLIAETEQQITALGQSPNVVDPTVAAQLNALRSILTSLIQEHSDLLRQLNQAKLDVTSITSPVTLTAPAAAPPAPASQRTVFFSLLGMLAGFVIAAGAVGLLELLDNTVKPTTNVADFVGAPVLANVNSLPKMRPGSDQLFILGRPISSAAESIRLMRTNIDYATTPEQRKRLMVTSPGSREGKTTVVANLAVAMAHAGSRVVVIDADFHHPALHVVFGVGNGMGLSTLLAQPEVPWRRAALDVMPNLTLIASGPEPPNPAEMLGSWQLRSLLRDVGEEADSVLIDVPPALVSSGPHAVAGHVDGVLLVCRVGFTSLGALRHAASSLSRSGTPILGVVLNRHPKREPLGGFSRTNQEQHHFFPRRAQPQANGIHPVKPVDSKMSAPVWDRGGAGE